MQPYPGRSEFVRQDNRVRTDIDMQPFTFRRVGEHERKHAKSHSRRQAAAPTGFDDFGQVVAVSRQAEPYFPASYEAIPLESLRDRIDVMSVKLEFLAEQVAALVAAFT